VIPTFAEQQEQLKKHDLSINKKLQKQNERIKQTSQDYGIDLDMKDFLKAGSIRFVKEQNRRKMLREKKYQSIGGDDASRKLSKLNSGGQSNRIFQTEETYGSKESKGASGKSSPNDIMPINNVKTKKKP